MPSTNMAGGEGGRDRLLDEPLYMPSDVADMLHVPAATLRYWVRGATRRVNGRDAIQRVPPLVGDGSGLLSFQDLAELSVVAHLRHLGFSITLLRRAANEIKATTGKSRPFLNCLLAGGATEIALQEGDVAVSMTHGGQRVLSLPVDEIFKRIETQHDAVVIVRPFSRPNDPYHDPALIEIDPRRRFGRPVTRPNGLDVAAIYDRRQWGESVEELMEDLQAGKEEIEEAIKYQELYLKVA